MNAVLIEVARKLLGELNVAQGEPEHLAQALAQGSMGSIEGEQVLCREGDPSDRLFVLLEGTVDVLRNDRQGNPRLITVVNGPALIGHMGLIDRSPRSATCVTRDDTVAVTVTIDLAAFDKLMRQADEAGSAWRHLLLASLIRQLGNTNQTVSALVSGMDERQAAERTAPIPKRVRRPKAPIGEDDVQMLAAILQGWSASGPR